jgi:hypothetical protein
MWSVPVTAADGSLSGRRGLNDGESLKILEYRGN